MSKWILLGGLAGLMMAGCATGPDHQTRAAQAADHVQGAPTAEAKPSSPASTSRPLGTYELRCTSQWTGETETTFVKNHLAYTRLPLLPTVFVGQIVPKVVPEYVPTDGMPRFRLLPAGESDKDSKQPEQSGGTNSEPDPAPPAHSKF